MAELVDLETLVLRCRQDRARTYIREAVACYHAGAYRAAVVSTWIAVVYDFIGKLDQLALAGDAKAHTRLEEFKKICRDHDVTQSLKFERSILEFARTEFELLSKIESQDLTRLMEDRHRCAHPSMLSEDETYDPGPETARYHLRNAVESMLQHEPAQGKYALQKVLSDLDSSLFPARVDEVITRLEGGPLKNPRRSLLRNYVVALFKILLVETPPAVSEAIARIKQEIAIDIKHDRVIRSLRAIHRMHPARVGEILRADLPRILENMEDGRMRLLVKLLATLLEALDAVPAAQTQRLMTYVSRMPSAHLGETLASAWKVEKFRPAVEARIERLTASEWVKLGEDIDPAWLPHAIRLYKSPGSFEAANTLGRVVLIPHAGKLSKEQAADVIECVRTNDVRGSFAFPNVLRALAGAEAIGVAFVRECLGKTDHAEAFKEVLSSLDAEVKSS